MSKFIKLNLIICAIAVISSCATSMTPVAVSNTLPSLTKSRFITRAQAENDANANICKYLIKGRTYVAPIGLTNKNDLKNAAKGIDEWVKVDGGNSYVLVNYKWIIVDYLGSTQLHVEFDTVLYK